MKKNLIILNAFAIACELSKTNMCKHLTVSSCDKGIDITFFFKLNDENAKKVKKMIQQSTNYTPEYGEQLFVDSEFETLTVTWEF